MTIDAKNVLRLNMPQWQRGDRPDYRLGAKVLAAIAPELKRRSRRLRYHHPQGLFDLSMAG